MGRARGANAIMHAGFEATYGAPPSTGWLTMPFVSSGLGATRGLIESDLLGQGRAPFDPTPDVVTNDGDLVVPIDTMAFGHWLKALLGPPESYVDAVAGFSHYFPSGRTVLPSLSIEHSFPDVPSHSVNYGARLNSMQFTAQRSGLLNATFGVIARGETVPAPTSVVTGAAVLPGGARFGQATGSLSIDDVVIGSIVSGDLSFSNGYDKVETIRAGGEIEDADPGMPMASGKITVKFADNALMTKAIASTPVNIKFLFTHPSGANVQFEVPRAFLPRAKTPISGPGGVQRDYDWQGASSGLPLLRILYNNARPTY